jgi:hypothetical protein
MSSLIYSNSYHIKEWFVLTPTVGTYTLFVQMCVKSQVGYLPREAVTIGHEFSFKKTELILRPVFALISQALQSIEYIAILLCLFIDIKIRIHGLRVP